MKSFKFGIVISVVLLALAGQAAFAGPLREWLAERKAGNRQDAQSRQDDSLEPDEPATGGQPLPRGVRMLADIAYGPDRSQRMDVYLPPGAAAAPVVFMVHGGGWRRGDKRAGTVV